MSKLSRRDFIKTGALLGSSTLLATQSKLQYLLAEEERGGISNLNAPENIINSVCLQCNTGCSIKVKILDGIAAKIDGNPYSPWTFHPHISYKTDLNTSARIDGAICPKGQAGIQSNYDPYRIVKVLKRSGPRGSGKFEAIDFQKAVEEIVNGGKLFAHIEGEENRVVEGLKDICVLKDKEVFKEMGKKVKEILDEKDKDKKKQLVEEFKLKFKDHLHTLIDIEHPDLGPKNNQLIWNHGRLKGGRKTFFERFIVDSLGSVNFHGHTTVCQGSLYFAGKSMSEQYEFDKKDKKFKWTGGKKFYWQADLESAEFVIFVGASPFEGNYGPSYRVNKITEGLVSGRLKYAVVDPRFSKTAAKSWKWLPVKPGTEGALAMAMTSWIIENGRYNTDYLCCANKGAVLQINQPSWTNAPWLVKIDEKGEPGEFLRGSDIGIEKEKRETIIEKEGKEEKIEYEFDKFVVLLGGEPVAFDPYDEGMPVKVELGDLLVDTEVQGIHVKSGLQLIYEEAGKHSIDDWAKICGISPDDIIDLANAFTSHGHKAVVDMHRGVSQHTNGFYNCLAFNTLNLLVGNIDKVGGSSWGSAYDITGEKAKGPYNFKEEMHPEKKKPFGLSIIRHEIKYEQTTIFNGYPAKRPFFPLSSDVYQEVIPSISDAYPYPVKALILHFGTPVYSLPAGHLNIDVLCSPSRLPLFIASDIMVGGTTLFADYIIPDITYLERFDMHGTHPCVLWKTNSAYQPTVAPVTETVKVFGQEMPLSLEAFFLAIAEKMNLPGFGKDGLGAGMDLIHPDNLYLKLCANLAFGEKDDASQSLPEASDEEINVFIKARKHLPKPVFDLKRWKESAGEQHFKRVVYLLNRGGRFDDYPTAYEGENLKNKHGKLVNMYCEKVARTKNSMSGKNFLGYCAYLPLMDCVGKSLPPPKDDEFILSTYREIVQTKQRTMSNYWLLSILPENFILVNGADAKRHGLKGGDKVRIISPYGNKEGVWDLKGYGKKPIVGMVKVTEGIRPGVVSFCLGFGHWTNGAGDLIIDGKKVKGDERRGRGVMANAAMEPDPHLKNVSLQDIVGGSVVFYDSRVKLVKV